MAMPNSCYGFASTCLNSFRKRMMMNPLLECELKSPQSSLDSALASDSRMFITVFAACSMEGDMSQ